MTRNTIRDGACFVVGITRRYRDTLDPKAGSSRGLNLATGRGTIDAQPATASLAPVPATDWSDNRLPRGCGG